MRRCAGDLFTAGNIRFRLRAPDSDQHLKIGADTRRQVFLIFKEAVPDIVRHSRCQRADMELGLERSRLVLRIAIVAGDSIWRGRSQEMAL